MRLLCTYKLINVNFIELIKDEDAKLKLRSLSLFVLSICTLSHGNADPERGSSINRYMLKIRGSSTSQKTIEMLCLVKDFIILHGVVNDLNISKAMIKKSSEARQR